MKSAISTSLLRLAMVLFFLNATNAFGACCVEPAEADSVKQLPCHQTKVTVEEKPSGDCCLMCLPLLHAGFSSNLSPFIYQADVKLDDHVLATTGVDPPFRPPITNLS